MASTRSEAHPWAIPATCVLAAVLCTVLVVPLTGSGPTEVAAVLAGVGLVVAVLIPVLRRRPFCVTPADHVTLARLVLVGACASIAVIALGGAAAHRSWLLVTLAGAAILLDLLDGPVARRTGTAGPEGAAFDNDADAALVAVLSVLLAPVVGWWVLLIGAMRYLVVAASWRRPWLRVLLPPSRFRRGAGAWAGGSLVVAVAPALPLPVLQVGLGVVLVLLTVSFGLDVHRLERGRTPAPGPEPSRVGR